MPRHQSSNNGNGSHQPNGERALAAPAESIPEFMERDPAGYARAVDLFEDGHSPGGVAALCRIHIQLARKIRNLMGETAIAAGIRQVARNLTEASQLMSERLVNEIDDLPTHALPNALALVVDRTQLLVGQPTVRIEHTKTPSAEDVMKMFESLPQAKAVDVAEEPPKPTQLGSYSAARPQRKLK